ncbi:MAG: trypsin-like peptidase domain-containing protein [Thermodesulfobacteriota bacterium]|nr:trypsin-like peptidase domain-containing protein [Thermodesulfobacteriota bacterium]
MKKTLFSLVALLIAQSLAFSGMPIPQEIKKCVCFIFIPQADGKSVPNGTGFFVSTEKPDKSLMNVYLVTAKHVLKPDPEKAPFFPLIVLRLMKKEGGVESISVPLVLHGEKQTIFVHDDEKVDLAVIPALPSPDRYDFKTFPIPFVATTNDIAQLEIGEGSDVFFTGMFTPHLGKDQNYPVVRFGRVSLMSEELIHFMGEDRRLYLIETFSFGGNSGSPCFLHLGVDRKPGSISGGTVLRLFGVVSGTYQKGFPIQEVPTATQQMSLDNMGISAITPAQFLYDIIMRGELEKRRGY